MKIYTKSGDKGETQLLDGISVPKCHVRVEAYGTVDELNAHIGLLRDMTPDDKTKKHFFEIQKILFVIQSRLAAENLENITFQLPEIPDSSISFLEQEIDNMTAITGRFKSFLIPGGAVVISQCHIARCVCRRAERNIVALAQNHFVEEKILQYINRLSDYLFLLARYFSHELHIDEQVWDE